MADRSDDIKQLFAHLGLNPGDYQELRGRTRVGTPDEAAAVASKIEPFIPNPAASAVVPPAAVPPVPVPPRAAPVVPPPAKIPAAEASQRWSLLQAVGRTPPQVAQIAPVPVARSVPAMESVLPSVQRASVPMTRSVDLSDLPTMPPVEERPTQALFAELQRVSQRRSSASFSAVDWAQTAAAQTPAVSASTPAVPVSMSTPAAPQQAVPAAFSVAAQPSIATPVTPPAAARAAAPAAKPRPPRVVPQPMVSSAPVSQVSDSLVGTFKRLVQPVRQAPQASGRLRLNYGKRTHAAPPSAPSQVREENLGDVFNRISAPPRAR